jgi:hypothetical protein
VGVLFIYTYRPVLLPFVLGYSHSFHCVFSYLRLKTPDPGYIDVERERERERDRERETQRERQRERDRESYRENSIV